jgi:twitching motility protein PilT
MDISELLAFSVKNKASDLHLSAGLPPMIRVHGDVRRINLPPLEHKDVHSMIYDIMTDAQRKQYDENLECDFSFDLPGLARFRVNAFNQDRGAAAVLRTIPSRVLSLEELQCPRQFADFSLRPRGLVLVTGPTGSGKSTTLAAMVDHVNNNLYGHVLTIEDPIEFVHESRKCVINQREVGLDTKTLHRALRSAMRAAPDVILIGEIRDQEAMRAAITLAGTGHLCIATLHANNAPEALDRIINLFPPDEHAQVLLDLSQYLCGILAQRLVRGADQRHAAVEVLINTPHMQDLIRRGDTVAVKEALQSSSERGMQSFDAALTALVRSGRVTLEEALRNADSRANLEAEIGFG